MPKGQYDRSKAKRRSPSREEILAAAMRIYAQYGFEGATISRMAEAAGVSGALIHALFGDKQGIVKAAVSSAVEQNLQCIRLVDETPGLCLTEREARVHAIYKENRDQWRLIYGTLLVPSFAFDLRAVIEGYHETECQNLLRYQKEFRDASDESVRAFAYAMLGLRQQYVLDGREQDCLAARQRLLDLFLENK